MVDYARLARSIRRSAVLACASGQSSHIGSGLSCVDILTVLYANWLRVSPATVDSPERDRFILSKGHAAAAYYSALAEFGFIPKDWLESFCLEGSRLGGHVHHSVPGVEVSSGSLGHGLPLGVGMALGAKRGGRRYRVVVLLSDGELDSGANWEAIMLAAAHKLDNLLAIVDRNGMQAMGRTEEIIPLEDLSAKWQAFKWSVRRIDGHSFADIENALLDFPYGSGPSAIIADTVKGKGISFMADSLVWHYRSPSIAELESALKELGEE